MYSSIHTSAGFMPGASGLGTKYSDGLDEKNKQKQFELQQPMNHWVCKGDLN